MARKLLKVSEDVQPRMSGESRASNCLERTNAGAGRCTTQHRAFDSDHTLLLYARYITAPLT